MTGSIARQHRSYLTPFEAANELSTAFGERFKDTDVLRLGLDGHLQLSLYLPVPVKAGCYFPDKHGLVDSSRPSPQKEIVGLCDILMVDFGRAEVEFRYQWEVSGNYVPRFSVAGATVEQDGLYCSLPSDRGETGLSPRPPSAFPQGAVLCVRRDLLDAFIAKNRPPHSADSETTKDRPLGARERTTLLLMIDALATEAKIDLGRASKAGTIIAAMMRRRGHEYSDQAIALHVRALRKLLTGAEHDDHDDTNS
jgi:hypothetical protein